MSLASDILWHAFVVKGKEPRKQQPPAKPVKPKPAVTAVSNRGLHLARVPGCQRLAHGWQVTCMDGKQHHTLGTFQTMPRARIAWRLWHLWKRRGFADIPTGPNHAGD